MDSNRIRDYRLADPFTPFDVVLNDGRRIPIRKAYHVAIDPNGKYIVCSTESGFEIVKTHNVSDLVYAQSSPTAA